MALVTRPSCHFKLASCTSEPKKDYLLASMYQRLAGILELVRIAFCNSLQMMDADCICRSCKGMWCAYLAKLTRTGSARETQTLDMWKCSERAALRNVDNSCSSWLSKGASSCCAASAGAASAAALTKAPVSPLTDGSVEPRLNRATRFRASIRREAGSRAKSSSSIGLEGHSGSASFMLKCYTPWCQLCTCWSFATYSTRRVDSKRPF